MSFEEIQAIIEKEKSYMEHVTEHNSEINIAYLLITDVMKETSYVMYAGKNAAVVLKNAFSSISSTLSGMRIACKFVLEKAPAPMLSRPSCM